MKLTDLPTDACILLAAIMTEYALKKAYIAAVTNDKTEKGAENEDKEES